MIRATILALPLVAMSSVAAAEPAQLATEPLALAARGVSLSYEHPLTPRTSVAGIGAYRSAADGDYDSNTFTFGGQLRVWLRARTPMRGPFVGARLTVGHTRVSVDQMGHIGSATSFNQRVDLGWRFVIKNRVTIAPSLGIAVHEDVSSSGRLSPIGHGSIGIGLEVGWLDEKLGF